MRNLILPLALVATLVTSTMAFAATDSKVTGTIHAINAKACIVTVGKTAWHFAKGCDFSKLKVGEKVTVTGHAYKKIEVGVSIVAAAPAKPMVKPMAKMVTKAVVKK